MKHQIFTQNRIYYDINSNFHFKSNYRLTQTKIKTMIQEKMTYNGESIYQNTKTYQPK